MSVRSFEVYGWGLVSQKYKIEVGRWWWWPLLSWLGQYWSMKRRYYFQNHPLITDPWRNYILYKQLQFSLFFAKSQMDPKLFNLIFKIIIVTRKTFQNLCFRFARISLKFFKDFLWNPLTLSIFELEKCHFFKWVRISLRIDWYHYQGACPAPLCIVQHETLIKTPIS